MYIYRLSTEEGKKVDIQKFDLTADIEHLNVEDLEKKQPEVQKEEVVEQPKIVEEPVKREVVGNYDDEGSDDDY